MTRGETSTFRVSLLQLSTIAIFTLLVGQLAVLQFMRGPDFQARATFNRLRTVRPEGERGVIYDRDGRILARNTARFNISVIPASLPDDPDPDVSQAKRRALYEELLRLTRDALAQTDIAPTVEAAASTKATNPYTVQHFVAGQTRPPQPQLLTIDEIETLVRKREAGSAFQPVIVARDLPRQAAMRVEEERYRLPGVEIQTLAQRLYPSGPDTGHLIGYMGPIPEATKTLYQEKGYSADAWVGWSGLEFTFEDTLRGQNGRRVIEVDVNGREQAVVGEEEPARPGKNLILSLDLELQDAMTQALEQGVDPKRTSSAVAVAMDPHNGFILGLVSLPTYDNNIFADGITEEEYKSVADAPAQPLLNRAVSGIYPPGSTFKMVAAAGALQEKVISPFGRLNDPGIIYLPNRNFPDDPNLAQPFVCWIYKLGGAHGDVNVTEAIAESCDVFFYKLGGGWYATQFDGLGEEALAQYALQFGFGAATGIDLPGENRGLIPTEKWKRITKGERWVTGDTYNMSIGQGDVLATPLQMASYTAAIANDGRLYRPQLVAAVTNSDSRLVKRMKGDLIRQVDVSPKNLAVVREGMRMTVNWALGTAPNAALPDVVVAGKTGTAEFYDPAIPRDNKGNLPTHAWFTAFAPFDEPEIVVTVFVFNGGEGSATAAPIARSILRSYFDLKNRDAAAGSRSILEQLQEAAP